MILDRAGLKKLNQHERLHFVALLIASARFALAQLAQSLPRINAVVVLVAESELHPVAPDMFGCRYGQVILKRARIKYAKASDFVDASRASALAPEISSMKYAHMAIVPPHGQFLRRGFFYLCRYRHIQVTGNREQGTGKRDQKNGRQKQARFHLSDYLQISFSSYCSLSPVTCPLLVLPLGRALGDECLYALHRVFVRHQFVEIDVF